MKFLLIIFICVYFTASLHSERKRLDSKKFDDLLSNLEEEKNPQDDNNPEDEGDHVTPPEIIVTIILCIFAGVSFYVCFFICVFAFMVASVLIFAFFTCFLQILPVLPMGLTGVILWARGHRTLDDESEGEGEGDEENTSSEENLEDILLKRGKYANYEPTEFGDPNFLSSSSGEEEGEEQVQIQEQEQEALDEEERKDEKEDYNNSGLFPPPPHFSPSKKSRLGRIKSENVERDRKYSVQMIDPYENETPGKGKREKKKPIPLLQDLQNRQ